MIDPMVALESLQEAIVDKTVTLSPCELHSDIQVLIDRPNNDLRITYAKIEKNIVQAIALIISTEPVDGIPCFQVGYAVKESMRNQGLGSKITQQGLDELTNGLARNRINEFYIEAIVSVDNMHSIKIANKVISGTPKPCNDGNTNEPALQYFKKIKK